MRCVEASRPRSAGKIAAPRNDHARAVKAPQAGVRVRTSVDHRSSPDPEQPPLSAPSGADGPAGHDRQTQTEPPRLPSPPAAGVSASGLQRSPNEMTPPRKDLEAAPLQTGRGMRVRTSVDHVLPWISEQPPSPSETGRGDRHHSKANPAVSPLRPRGFCVWGGWVSGVP